MIPKLRRYVLGGLCWPHPAEMYEQMLVVKLADPKIITVTLIAEVVRPGEPLPVSVYSCICVQALIEFYLDDVNVGTIVWIESVGRYGIWVPVGTEPGLAKKMVILKERLYVYPPDTAAFLIEHNLQYYTLPIFSKSPFPDFNAEPEFLRTLSFIPATVNLDYTWLQGAAMAREVRALFLMYDRFIQTFPYSSTHIPFYRNMITVYRENGSLLYTGEESQRPTLYKRAIAIYEKCVPLIEKMNEDGQYLPVSEVEIVFKELIYAYSELGEFPMAQYYLELWGEIYPDSAKLPLQKMLVKCKELIGRETFVALSRSGNLRFKL